MFFGFRLNALATSIRREIAKFALRTESSDIITTESGNFIVLEQED